jgi:hypothetical protein
MSQHLEDLQHVQHALLEASSEGQLNLSRAMPYGAAATCFAILCAMTQVASRGIAAQFAIVGATAALPLWLVVATIYEFYLYLGRDSHQHYKSAEIQRLIKHVSYFAGVALLLSVGGLVHVLLPWATYAFVFACLSAFWVLHRFQTSLAAWWRVQSPRQDRPR